MPLQNLDINAPSRCGNSEPGADHRTQEVRMTDQIVTPSDSPDNPTTEQSRRFDANSREAYALWARRVGMPLYSYTQQHVAWAVRCPSCGQLVLLEIVFDSEDGGYFKPEACSCGGGL